MTYPTSVRYPTDEISRQQRDGARCGCRVCASAVRTYPMSNPDEPPRLLVHYPPRYAIDPLHAREGIAGANARCLPFSWLSGGVPATDPTEASDSKGGER
jgi:hypothetical protein